jgi:PPK2 family polyphosphate:nucleotide phosphotransferase
VPSVREALRLPPGPVDLSKYDTAATPLAPGGKAKTSQAFEESSEELFELGERMYAQAGGERPVRLVVFLQGMDGSGKGGGIKHVGRKFNPQVLEVAAFGRPTEEELLHHFLWRIRRRVPGRGRIAFFDRSHYEDVLVARVRRLVPPAVWEDRYAEIDAFEQELVEGGVTLLKVFLHVSPSEQLERLGARLDDPSKLWKYNPRDLDDHERWPAYMKAYEDLLERCNPPWAPWHVLPADRKWYRTWALSRMVAETLHGLDLRWPERPDLDVEAERRRIAGLAG